MHMPQDRKRMYKNSMRRVYAKVVVSAVFGFASYLSGFAYVTGAGDWLGAAAVVCWAVAALTFFSIVFCDM